LKTSRTIAALLLLAAAAGAVPSLTVAYHRDDHAAPLFDACLYPNDFRERYGLYLKQAGELDSYSLFDGKHRTLSLRLASFDTDSAVLAALLSGSAQVGILASEEVLGAVLKGRPVRIVAPLQHAGDMLVVNGSIPVTDGKEFFAWAKGQNRQVTVGHVGSHSMTVLGFCQALEYENVTYERIPPAPETTRIRLVRFEDWVVLAVQLELGQIDAAILQEPAATLVSAVDGNRTIGRIDILPPGRFEDRPGSIIAATDSTISTRGEDVGRFLELMAVATHYANNRTRNTLAAVCRWLDMSPGLESIPLGNIGFSSRPDAAFTTGIWNWYFALRLRNAVPESLAGYMEEKDWLGVPYDSLLLMPALERAGARIIR
jgi:hypothetical protein